jgi:hypothetical protein
MRAASEVSKMRNNKKNNDLPVVYVPRGRSIQEILVYSEKVEDYEVRYYWFRFPYDWFKWLKPYDWEPVAFAYKNGVATKVFWRPHYVLKCGRPVRHLGRPVIYISRLRGNAPRVTLFWVTISLFGYKRIPDDRLVKLIKEGLPPEEEANVESFMKFVRERINSCGNSTTGRALRALVELLKACKAYWRRDVESMFRHVATAFLTAPRRYRLSDAGHSLLYTTIMLWAAHKYGDEKSFKRERFFADFDGFDRELLLHALLILPLSLAKPPRSENDLKKAAAHHMKAFGINT